MTLMTISEISFHRLTCEYSRLPGTRNCTKRRGVVARDPGYHPHPNSSNSQLHLKLDPSFGWSHHRKHRTSKAGTKYRPLTPPSFLLLLLPPSPTPLPISSPLYFTAFFHSRHHHLAATRIFCWHVSKMCCSKLWIDLPACWWVFGCTPCFGDFWLSMREEKLEGIAVISGDAASNAMRETTKAGRRLSYTTVEGWTHTSM